ncbi:MAG: hypothetical protein M3Q11_05335 [Pseudomonadota bacterium]|nr:hypothetical protein [Pseudomonadota bacterium]
MPAGLLRILLLGGLVIFASGCASLFPVEADEDLAHFATQAPQPGQTAPELEARRLDGTPVRLSEILDGKRPVVLQLGSHSCPVYRYRRFDIAKLQREYAGDVAFVVVYTVEAHPEGSKSPYRDGEWLTNINRITRTRVRQPESTEARIAQAIWSTEKLGRNDMVVVDTFEDQTWQRYGSAPSAAFVIDTAGNIVLRQPWVEPDGIRRALDGLLQRDGTTPGP